MTMKFGTRMRSSWSGHSMSAGASSGSTTRIEDVLAGNITEQVEDGGVQQGAPVEAAVIAQAVVDVVVQSAVRVERRPVLVADIHRPILARRRA